MIEHERLSQDWVGSVSHGTMREEDLIPAFEAVLGQSGVEFQRPQCVDVLLSDGAYELSDSEWEEVGWYLNETLVGLLDEIAPEGCYFGAHPGDGSDYGFWPVDENEPA